MRKLVRVLAASLLTLGAGLSLAAPAGAQTRRPVASVIQISGLLDRVQSDFWIKALHDADRSHAAALVVQLDSNRSVLSQAAFSALAEALDDASTPVAIWVGPARAGSVGGTVVGLLGHADAIGLAPGAKIRPLKTADLSWEDGGRAFACR